MKISIIVPIYKTEQYLPKCIDSILAQTFTDFELLLINDGSPDRCGAICDEYAAKDSRIRVFHKENGGVSSARNVGLDNAQGEWISFIDSDDWVERDYLTPISQNVDADIIRIGFKFETSVGKWKTINFSKTEILSISVYIKKRIFPIQAVSYIAKAYLIDESKLRFNTKMKYAEDSLFWMIILLSCKNILISNSACYHYRYNSSSITNIKREYSVCCNALQFILSIHDFINERNNQIVEDELKLEANFCAKKMLFSFVSLLSKNNYKEVSSHRIRKDFIEAKAMIDTKVFTLIDKIICGLFILSPKTVLRVFQVKHLLRPSR